MLKKKEYILKIKEYENNFKKFVGNNAFPQYTIFTKEISLSVVDIQGYDSIASTHYDVQKGIHTLTISSNIEIYEYIIFHEFTHMLDSELYVNNDKIRYIGLSGFTEYHASQVELMKMLGAKSIFDRLSFSINTTINTISGYKSVKQYLVEKQQHAIELFSRKDFPSCLETLKSALGVLFNYWGLRSICEMYATDYVEEIKNQIFLKYIPTFYFISLNNHMRGWLNNSNIDVSISLYVNTFSMLATKYKLV